MELCFELYYNYHLRVDGFAVIHIKSVVKGEHLPGGKMHLVICQIVAHFQNGNLFQFVVSSDYNKQYGFNDSKKMAGNELSKGAKNHIERIKEQQNLEARITLELEENEEVQKYLEPYGEFLRDTFLQSYTHQKCVWIQYADMFQREAESDALEYRPDAEECL